MVNNSTTNINKHHLWLQLIEWWSTIPQPISTTMELLTIIQWVEVRGDFCWYWWNCWPSLNEFRWEVILVDFGGIVDFHSMSWSERWFNNSTNININHISPKFIEWWSTIPPISTKIISHFNSLSDGQQFH
jgi:hypothetical protein